MIGKTNSNLMINGPTYNLNGEYFGYAGSNMFPTVTIKTGVSGLSYIPQTVPPQGTGMPGGLLAYFQMYGTGTNVTDAFSIDFTNVKWKYNKVAVLGGFVCTQSNHMAVRNNGEVIANVSNPNVGEVWFPLNILDIDLDVDPVLKVSGYSGGGASYVRFYIMNCIGYLR